MSEIIIEEINSKKPQSEAVKRGKAKYYSKRKLDPEFMEQNRNKAKEYYTHNSERHQNKCKEYYLEHKQEIYDQAMNICLRSCGRSRFQILISSSRSMP
jgi:hypothetical protein